MIIFNTQKKQGDKIIQTIHPYSPSEEKIHREYIETITRNDPCCFHYVSIAIGKREAEVWIWGDRLQKHDKEMRCGRYSQSLEGGERIGNYIFDLTKRINK